MTDVKAKPTNDKHENLNIRLMNESQSRKERTHPWTMAENEPATKINVVARAANDYHAAASTSVTQFSYIV